MTDSGTDIDLAGLERVLAERLDANVTDAAVVADGLNLVVDVSTPDGRYSSAGRTNFGTRTT